MKALRILTATLLLLAAPSIMLAAQPATQALKAPAKPPAKTIAAKPAIPPPTTPAAPQPKPALFYDFKGARLGMTLEEFKASPPPKLKVFTDGGFADSEQAPELECGPGGLIAVSDLERSLGVVFCSYKHIRFHHLPIGSASASIVHYFFMDNKLYKIHVGAKSSAFDEIMDGLTTRFGSPDELIDDTTQNGAGATFPHHVRLWANPAAQIYVETPWKRIDDLAVIYETTEGARKLQALRVKTNPSAEKM